MSLYNMRKVTLFSPSPCLMLSSFARLPFCQPPPPPPKKKASVNPLDETPPASKYVMRQATSKASPLSSSFASTPKLLRAVLRRPPPRRPATGLLEKATWRDYLGVIPNPGHVPNSLLFGKGKESAYEVISRSSLCSSCTTSKKRRKKDESC